MTDVSARDTITEDSENQGLGCGVFYADQSLDGSNRLTSILGTGSRSPAPQLLLSRLSEARSLLHKTITRLLPRRQLL